MTHIETLTVTYSKKNPTEPKLGPHDTVRLWKGDHITVELKNFEVDATIEKIEFYNNRVNEEGKNSKDKDRLLGEWTTKDRNSPGLIGYFMCAVDSTKQVMLIVDTEDNEDDARYWISASGMTGVNNEIWSIDPDVINKGR